jgi:hypothetical protein
MIRCSKCDIEKEVDQYSTYFHSTQNKLRTRKVCKSCFNHQKSIYRESIKKEKIIDSTPVSVSPTPIPIPTYIPTPNLLVNPEVFIDMDTKVCYTCKIEKPLTDFYIHSQTGKPFTHCKRCESDKGNREYQQYIEDNGGSDKVRKYPGQWVDSYQQENVEGFLKVMGWKHNGKHWYKEGVRSGEDGIWERMRGMKKYRKPPSVPKKSPVLERLMVHIEDIIKLRKEGMTFSKIGYIYNTSSPYITKVITKYYEAQEDSGT